MARSGKYLYGELSMAITSVLAVILNILMIFAVYGSKIITRAFKLQIIITGFVSLLYTLVNVLANPKIAVLYDEDTVLFVKAGIYTDFTTGVYLLILFVMMILITAVNPTIQFCYRYLIQKVGILKPRNKWDSSWIAYLIAIPLFFSTTSALYFGYKAMPTRLEVDRFYKTAFFINTLGNTSFLVASLKEIADPVSNIRTFKKDPFIYGSIIYVLTVLMVAAVVIVYTAVAWSRVIPMGKTSKRTLVLQRKTLKTIAAQALISFGTVHLPFYLCCLAPLLDFDISTICDWLPFLFDYYPVLLPLTVLYHWKSAINNIMVLVRGIPLFQRKISQQAWAPQRY